MTAQKKPRRPAARVDADCYTEANGERKILVRAYSGWIEVGPAEARRRAAWFVRAADWMDAGNG